MPVAGAKCIRTKTYKTYNTKREIVLFEEGKVYPTVYVGNNISYVISETGYKEIFNNDFYKYFIETYQ